MGTFLGGSVSDIIKSKKNSNSGSKGGALTLIPVVKSGNGAGKTLADAVKEKVDRNAGKTYTGYFAGGASGGGSGSVGTVTQAPETVVSSGEYSGGVSDLSDYLRQQQQAATEAALAGLKSAYDKNALLYDNQRSQLSPLYAAQRNALAADVAQSRRNYDERALASGLNTGTAGQADLARNSVLTQGMADIQQAEADALAEIDLARKQLQAEYENAIAQQKAADGAALLQKLYEEAVRVQNAQLGSAAVPSYTTVSTPYVSGGSGGTYGSTLADRLAALSGKSVGGGNKGGALTLIPVVNSGSGSRSGTGMNDFSNFMRTVNGTLAGGDKKKAEKLVASKWNTLSTNQKKDLQKMGFRVK